MKTIIFPYKIIQADIDYVIDEKISHYNEDNNCDFCICDFDAKYNPDNIAKKYISSLVDYIEDIFSVEIHHKFRGILNNKIEVDIARESIEDIDNFDIDIFERFSHVYDRCNLFLFLYDNIDIRLKAMDTLDCIYVKNFIKDKEFLKLLENKTKTKSFKHKGKSYPVVLVNEDHLQDYCDYYHLNENEFKKSTKINETIFYYR